MPAQRVNIGSILRQAQSRLAKTGEGANILPMPSTYTAIVQQQQGWWIGWIEEVPGVNAQERTKDLLLASLKEVLKEALEMNREEARANAPGDYSEELVTV